MWQFILGVLLGGTIGFLIAALFMGANIYRNDCKSNFKSKENNPPRND